MNIGIKSLAGSGFEAVGSVAAPLAQMGYPQKPNIGPVEMLIGFGLTLLIFGGLAILFRKVEK